MSLLPVFLKIVLRPSIWKYVDRNLIVLVHVWLIGLSGNFLLPRQLPKGSVVPRGLRQTYVPRTFEVINR